MLDERELRDLRADYVRTFLTQRARLLRLDETQNDNGDMENQYVPFGPIIPCRISMPRLQNEAVQGSQVQAEGGAVLEVEVGTKIDSGDKIAVVENAKRANHLRDGSLLGAQVWSVAGSPDLGRAEAQFLSVPVVRVD